MFSAFDIQILGRELFTCNIARKYFDRMGISVIAGKLSAFAFGDVEIFEAINHSSLPIK